MLNKGGKDNSKYTQIIMDNFAFVVLLLGYHELFAAENSVRFKLILVNISA
jgi:hypothetical protein